MTNPLLAWFIITVFLTGYLAYLIKTNSKPPEFEITLVSYFFFHLVTIIASLLFYDFGKAAILAPIFGLVAFLLSLVLYPRISGVNR